MDSWSSGTQGYGGGVRGPGFLPPPVRTYNYTWSMLAIALLELLGPQRMYYTKEDYALDIYMRALVHAAYRAAAAHVEP